MKEFEPKRLYTFDQFHIFGGDAGMELRASNAPESLLEGDKSQVFLIQSLNTLLIVALAHTHTASYHSCLAVCVPGTSC